MKFFEITRVAISAEPYVEFLFSSHHNFESIPRILGEKISDTVDTDVGFVEDSWVDMRYV